MISLEWFAKRFGPGDIDGAGAKRLLGTPTLPPAEVLLRETAQNSWDAGSAASSVVFSINVRKLTPTQLKLLRDSVFTGNVKIPKLGRALTQNTTWAIEISDRGTTGLNGPVRNDLEIHSGQATNFIDLVFNVGSTRDFDLGGGTYGFGKTIAYVLSQPGTILIWSQCKSGARTESRIIGSAISEPFNWRRKRYTGRHWWGHIPKDGERVEPLTGRDATTIGRQVFSRIFMPRETGTSILIVDPRVSVMDDYQGFAEEIANAALWNLWPKMVADVAERRTMAISVEYNSDPVDIPKVDSHGVLSGYAHCLRAIRATQAGKPQPTSPYPVFVQEIRSERPNKLLGHLALARYPRSTDVSFSEHSDSVALMRHGAELIVKYALHSPLSTGGFQWAGVFKPVEGVDQSFAMSEPPAHDDWIPAGIEDRRQKRDVNIALNRIRKSVDAFLNPAFHGPGPNEEAVPTAAVGDMLSDLVASSAGPRTSPHAPGRPGAGGGRRSSQPRLSVAVESQQASPTAGWARTRLSVAVEGASSKGVYVEVHVAVGIDGGSMSSSDVYRVIGWEDSTEKFGYSTIPSLLTEHSPGFFVFDARDDLAMDVVARVVES